MNNPVQNYINKVVIDSIQQILGVTIGLENSLIDNTNIKTSFNYIITNGLNELYMVPYNFVLREDIEAKLEVGINLSFNIVDNKNTIIITIFIKDIVILKNKLLTKKLNYLI